MGWGQDRAVVVATHAYEGSSRSSVGRFVTKRYNMLNIDLDLNEYILSRQYLEM